MRVSSVTVEWQFDSDIQDRVDNWVRWAKGRTTKPVSCKSLESRYRPPPVWEYPELKSMIDVLDAIIVESVIVSLPKKNLRSFVFSHIYPGYEFYSQCRKIGIAPSKYDETVNISKQMVQNKLRRRDGKSN